MLFAVACIVVLPRLAEEGEGEGEGEERSPVEAECNPEVERNALSQACFLSYCCWCCCFWVVAVSATLHH